MKLDISKSGVDGYLNPKSETPNIQQLCLAKVDEIERLNEFHLYNQNIHGVNSEGAVFLIRALRSVILRHGAVETDINSPMFAANYQLVCISCKVSFPCPELKDIAKELGI